MYKRKLCQSGFGLVLQLNGVIALGPGPFRAG